MRIITTVSTLASAAVAALLYMPVALLAQSEDVTFHKDIEPFSSAAVRAATGTVVQGPCPRDLRAGRPLCRADRIQDRLETEQAPCLLVYGEEYWHSGLQRRSFAERRRTGCNINLGRTGTPKGDIADAPEPLVFDDSIKWRAGEPDLVVVMDDITKLAGTADWWGEIPSTHRPTEDRYVKSVEVIEVNDVPSAGTGRETIGGRYIFHHMIWATAQMDENGERVRIVNPWPVHEVGRNADIFDEERAACSRPVPGSSQIQFISSNGVDTVGHLEVGFRFHDKDYKPNIRTLLSASAMAWTSAFRAAKGSGTTRLYRSGAAHESDHLRASSTRSRRADVSGGDLGLHRSRPFHVWATIITGSAAIPMQRMQHLLLKAQSSTLSDT